MKRNYVLGTALAVLFFQLVSSRGENWPCWRGPRGDGSSLETQVPTRWSATENVTWKTRIPGSGHSSPIVWDERVFLTTALPDAQERQLVSLERKTGAILWRETVLRAPLEAKNSENSFASSTPATDGRRIYTTFLDGKEVVVAAYDFSGKQLWLVRPGGFYSQHGFSHTPVLFDGKVIVACDSKGENFIVALDGIDGRTVWKVPRNNPTQSYSAPLIHQMGGRLQMVIPGNKAVTGYDPRDGKLLWVTDGPSEDCVITPVFNEQAGLVLSCSSWPKRELVAIRPDGVGNVTKEKIAWATATGAPYVPSPISVGSYFLTSSFSKEVFCFEAATGRVVWQQPAGLHHASPVSANGLVYFLNDDGVAHIFRVGENPELVARNELGEKTYASPAISRGQLFLRSFSNLYCIGRPD